MGQVWRRARTLGSNRLWFTVILLHCPTVQRPPDPPPRRVDVERRAPLAGLARRAAHARGRGAGRGPGPRRSRTTASRRGSIYTSDLQRAARTAEIIAAHVEAPVIADAGLPRAQRRRVAGLTGAEIDERWPGMRAAWRRGELTAPPGGEEDADVLARFDAALAARARARRHRGRVHRHPSRHPAARRDARRRRRARR